MQMSNAELQAADALIELAVAEDIGSGDITGECLLDKGLKAHARLLARQKLVVCGLPVVERIVEVHGHGLQYAPCAVEGDVVAAGTTLATLSGHARTLLALERILLNFAQRMSGVATLTREYVDAIAGTGAKLLDTRKTIPAWRWLDKYAVRTGGGHNHRMGLYDMVLIKDNHIALAGSVTQAVTKALAQFPPCHSGGEGIRIVVECDTLEQVAEAVRLPVSRLLLDNMNPFLLTEAVALVDGRMPLEASGGVTLATIRALANTGVDYISVGALTHSATAVDMALDVEIV